MHHYERRFGGIGRLYGKEGLERSRRAHVCVIGLGGVGSWAVEALARSGIGELTLVDLDDVCISNVNRQLHALDGACGPSTPTAWCIPSRRSSSSPTPARFSSRATIMCSMPSTARPASAC